MDGLKPYHVRCVAFSPDGKRIAAAAGVVGVWDVMLQPLPQFTWRLAKERQAVVTNVSPGPAPLNPESLGGLFPTIPARFLNSPSVIYAERSDFLLKFDVVEEGFVIVACNYDRQGREYQEFDERRWKPEKFIADGWRQLSDEEVGGKLTKNDNRTQVFFAKYLFKGDQYSLYCNTNDPPFLIQFDKSLVP